MRQINNMKETDVFGNGICSHRKCDNDLRSLEEIFVVHFPNRHMSNGELSYHKGYCCEEHFRKSDDIDIAAYEEKGVLNIDEVNISMQN